MASYHQQIDDSGFTIVNDIYTQVEIDAMIAIIENADQSKNTFRKTADLFAIRRFLHDVPGIKGLVFNNRLKQLISELFGGDYFIIKSIYFDKPERSNWFVAWHQDLTIAVDRRTDINGFGPWTTKPGSFAVQPPENILKENFTVRIHLDETDENNGALKVIKGSHHGVIRAGNIDKDARNTTFCKVKAGGVMVMRPLLMHASDRTTNNNKRRVIHIEFGRSALPEGVNWAEKQLIN